MRKVRATFDGTNWALLADQKQALVEAMGLIENIDPDLDLYEKQIELLEGLLNWIDALQDSAEEAGFPVVYKYSSRSK